MDMSTIDNNNTTPMMRDEQYEDSDQQFHDDPQNWKILCIFLFPLLDILGISLAVLLGTRTGNKLWFTCGVMFSSGILLAVAFCHALPHANMIFSLILENDTDSDAMTMDMNDDEMHSEGGHMSMAFPWSNMIFGLTFYVLMVIETCTERFVGKYISKSGKKDGSLFNHCSTPDDHKKAQEESGCNKHQTTQHESSSEDEGAIAVEAESVKMEEAIKEDTPKHQDTRGDVDEPTINPWVAILLLVVLSLHVILQGLTICSTEDVSSIEMTFIAIASHQAFAAFALGSSFITAGYWAKPHRKMFFVLASIYVSMDILGMGMGMSLTSVFQEDSLPSGIFMSMLGGSFLFVSACGLIPGELRKMREYQFPVSALMLALGVGYGLMVLLIGTVF